MGVSCMQRPANAKDGIGVDGKNRIDILSSLAAASTVWDVMMKRNQTYEKYRK